VFTQKECVSAVFRYIPSKILSLKELGLPPVLETFTRLPRGLVLVTGSTGSGKSTTLASMIDMINNERDVHIVTIEDPIEFIHHHKKSLINQREIGQDSLSFQRALKSVLREDPDVILLGEMRDLETIATAVTLAETGHLVFATLHTTSASQTVDRIIDVFPPEQQEQIRFQLSNVLEAIVTQTLLPKIGGGRVCACEILVMNSAARASIRNNKSTVLNDIMQMGSKLGMQTLEQSLVKLVTKGLVEKDVALGASSHPDILKQMLQK
jgi:twitching motility protein PilT